MTYRGKARDVFHRLSNSSNMLRDSYSLIYHVQSEVIWNLFTYIKMVSRSETRPCLQRIASFNDKCCKLTMCYRPRLLKYLVKWHKVTSRYQPYWKDSINISARTSIFKNTGPCRRPFKLRIKFHWTGSFWHERQSLLSTINESCFTKSLLD